MARRAKKPKPPANKPAQSIIPGSNPKRRKGRKKKTKMSSTGAKSWVDVLAGDGAPALPQSFTNNLNYYAGRRTNRPAVHTPVVPTPAVQDPAVHTPAMPSTTARIPAVPIPAVPIPAVRVPAVPIPAVPTPAVSIPAVQTTAAQAPAAQTSSQLPVAPSNDAPEQTPAAESNANALLSTQAAPRNGEAPSKQAPTKIGPNTLWELDPGYSGRRIRSPSPELGYRYNRQWISFGAAPKLIGGLLLRELNRQKRAGLPPLYVDIAEANLEPLRQIYERAGELDLFNKRLAIRKSGQPRGAYPASYVFQTCSLEKSSGPSLNEEAPLIKFLKTDYFAWRIVHYLKPCMRDIMSLATTCREASIWVSEELEVWDTSRGNFYSDGNFTTDYSQRSHIVVLTATESGLPVTPSPYRNDFLIMKDMLMEINATRFSFRDIVLDKIPFFDCKILEMMLGSMPYLETMAISNCLLMDVSKLERLLDIIARHPRASRDEGEVSLGEEVYVKMDWQPFFFNGLNGQDKSTSPGSFGVTHNPPTFNIPKAIFGLIMKSLPAAAAVGMDLLSEGSSFWRFVRRLPGPDVLWATKARDAICVYQLSCSRANTHTGAAREQKLRNAKLAFADDMTAALSGDGVEPIKPHPRFHAANRGLSFDFGYWREEKVCEHCNKKQLRTFFSIHARVCWACKMVWFVDTAEHSHMRHRLQSAIDFWAQGLDNNATLDDLLGVPVDYPEDAEPDAEHQQRARTALRAAEDIDHAWFHHLAYTTGPRGEEPLYPEPTNARPHARWFRRSLMVRDHVFPKGDYREGGPQHEHPALRPLYPDMQTHPDTNGCEPYEHFCATWVYNAKSEEALAKFFMDAKLHMYWLDLKMDDPIVQNYLFGARQNPRQRNKARELEWIAQNKANALWYMYAMADAEDCVVSHLGAGPMSWNRDKVKNAEWALRPLDYFGDYMGKTALQN